jgi:YHS domain-containing protein
VTETETDIGEYVVCSFDSEGEFVTADGEQVPPYEYEGKTYYFSSEECREAVTSDPDRYLVFSDAGEDTPDEGADGR